MDTPIFYNSNTQQISFLILILKIGYEDALPHLSYSPLAHLWQEIRNSQLHVSFHTQIHFSQEPRQVLPMETVGLGRATGAKNVGAESA